MAWLTVSEAAERLNISEAAVRKRMQRNTLEHTQWQDGRVYVYMPVIEDAEQDKEVHESENPDEKQQRSWWDIVAGVSGIVVVLGLMIYVLGLVTLWAPIMRTYTHDAVTAWHAVSLVPRPVVAGLGIRQLVAFPLFAAIAITVLCWAAYYVFRALQSRLRESLSHEAAEGSPPSASSEDSYEYEGLGLALCSVYGLVLLYAGWHVASKLAPSLGVSPWRLVLPTTFLVTTASFAFAFLLVLALSLWTRAQRKARKRENAGEPSEGSGLSPLSVLRGGCLILIVFCVGLSYASLWLFIEPKLLYQQLESVSAHQITDAVILFVALEIVLFVGPVGSIAVIFEARQKLPGYLLWIAAPLGSTFIAAFLLTFVSRPPLPAVDMAVDVNGSQGVEGTLLTHVDGYWYVFNTKGNLVAVPDDHVTNVNICNPTTGKSASICTQRSQDHQPAQPVREKHPVTYLSGGTLAGGSCMAIKSGAWRPSPASRSAHGRNDGLWSILRDAPRLDTHRSRSPPHTIP